MTIRTAGMSERKAKRSYTPLPSLSRFWRRCGKNNEPPQFPRFLRGSRRRFGATMIVPRLTVRCLNTTARFPLRRRRNRPNGVNWRSGNFRARSVPNALDLQGPWPVVIVSLDARNRHERADTVLVVPLTGAFIRMAHPGTPLILLSCERRDVDWQANPHEKSSE